MVVLSRYRGLFLDQYRRTGGEVRAVNQDGEANRKGQRLGLTADAFLFSAAFDIAVTTLLLGVPSALGADLSKLDALGPYLGSIISLVVTAIVVFAGAAFTWRMYGRRLDGRAIAGMVAGVVVGGPAAMAVFTTSAMLLSRIPGRREGPPWLAIGLLAVLAIAFAAVPIVNAVRDMSGGRDHLLLDRLRIIALLVTIGCSVALPFMGGKNGELGEAAIFMVPFAAAGALAALGADILDRSRRHTSNPEPATQP